MCRGKVRERETVQTVLRERDVLKDPDVDGSVIIEEK